jgi:hypothetical protein
MFADVVSALTKAADPPPPPPAAVRAAGPATEAAVLTSVQQELVRRQKAGVSRADSRLSVKSLIDSIENQARLAKNSQYPCLALRFHLRTCSVVKSGLCARKRNFSIFSYGLCKLANI